MDLFGSCKLHPHVPEAERVLSPTNLVNQSIINFVAWNLRFKGIIIITVKFLKKIKNGIKVLLVRGFQL